MWTRTLLFFFCLLLALAVGSEVKGGPDKPSGDEGLPVVPAPLADAEKHPKDHKHPPKDPKHPKEKHHKEKHHKKHKDPKDKHPKEDEPVAAASGDVDDASPEPEAETTQEEESKPATTQARSRRANHSFPVNRTEAAVEEEAQNAACGTCCGVDMTEMASKLPFVNRK